MTAAGAGPAGPLLLGVRHHGPGSARAVLAALAARAPRVLLVEGPPEADAVVALAGHEEMRPPVALLAHVADEPGRAAFWPLAEFSPEWVAIRWALAHGVPVRFFDLPAAHSLAMDDGGDGDGEGDGDGNGDGGPAGEEAPGGRELRLDPLRVLAETAGHDDPERWWEDVVEHRGGHHGAHRGETGPAADPYAPFAVLTDAMAALREAHGGTTGDGGHRRDAVREAHMRLRLREARREFGDDGVAVVCGAWHVPALTARTTVTADRQLLKGLPKARTEITWVPWTHERLARRSGYGAGITSPGWYGHLFTAPDRPVERWLTKVARLLRAEDFAVSSAHVIEAVRLADTLAALRGRPLPGLGETIDATRAVLCEGSDVPLALVHDRLTVGDVLGEVPDEAPAVPLQRDLARLQRSLRLKPEARERELELDLREENAAARSRLLHRLRLLGVDWGEPAASRTGGTGTFRETWRLCWRPELSVRIAEAGVWGTTVAAAATARAEALARAAESLVEVTELAERCLPAGLGDALPVVMRVLADRAALDTDVGHLAQALPALVRSVRYGDVRGTDATALREVAEGLAERVCVGLPPACAGLDADGAAELRGHLDAAHRAIVLLERADLLTRWRAVLRTLAGRDRVPGLLRGRCARLLLDDGRLPDGEAARLMGLALSPGTAPGDAAAWVEGFLADGGMLLVHDERLLALVDTWLSGIPGEAFTDVLPLLRRTFAAYEPGVRRTVGELVRRGPAGPDGRGGPGADTGETAPGFGAGLDEARADAVLPALRLLLGPLPADAAGTEREAVTVR
ncbi:DUF5682 family protein [Streptomyces sp. TRM 70361]|uniref:DUF5682 family protein n=1 Tax=Streptomyces sp. TRM 70361 TaxID=3116553 RepID=UPI002E7C3BAE|nr:DUF5682 family protein [Streptomyces sp. TRM 70361]MEE1939438.1 DUF5682 family protein [Streptomyces sp. TRM 70361]